MIAALIALGLLFALFAIFPKLDFALIHLWVRSDAEIRPTRLYVVWVRLFSSLWAVGLFGAAIALAVSNHRSAERVEDCTRLLSDVHDLYDENGFVDDDAAAVLAEKTDATIEVEQVIDGTAGDAYDRVTVQREGIDADLLPDTDIDTICDRLS